MTVPFELSLLYYISAFVIHKQQTTLCEVMYSNTRKQRSYFYSPDRISGVMVSVLASSAVDRGFEPQTKHYQIGICCFYAKHAALRSKNKNWLDQNQDNVYEWGETSIHILLFQ